MSGNFSTTLDNRVRISGSLLCIGLDPHSSQVFFASRLYKSPCKLLYVRWLSFLQLEKTGKCDADAATKFCVDIITETHQFAAAYKPNAAFFEQLGSEGIASLSQIMKTIPTDIPTILDFKRGDIETTAEVRYPTSSIMSIFSSRRFR
jgi:uridine monophosphate synthetase